MFYLQLLFLLRGTGSYCVFMCGIEADACVLKIHLSIVPNPPPPPPNLTKSKNPKSDQKRVAWHTTTPLDIPSLPLISSDNV